MSVDKRLSKCLDYYIFCSSNHGNIVNLAGIERLITSKCKELMEAKEIRFYFNFKSLTFKRAPCDQKDCLT